MKNFKSLTADLSLKIDCDRYSVEEISLLIGSGANVNVADAMGVTPLHRTGKCEEIQLLLEAGANFAAKCNAGLPALSARSLHISELDDAERVPARVRVREFIINRYKTLLKEKKALTPSLQGYAAECIFHKTKEGAFSRLPLPPLLIKYCSSTPERTRDKAMLDFCETNLKLTQDERKRHFPD